MAEIGQIMRQTAKAIIRIDKIVSLPKGECSWSIIGHLWLFIIQFIRLLVNGSKSPKKV